jgi:hypothetical protein
VTSKTITHAELVAALETVSIHTGRSSWGGSLREEKATYPDSLANDLFRAADEAKKREPEYEDKAVYRDYYGECWQYDAPQTAAEQGRWWSFCCTVAVHFDGPKRPLRKLSPETESEPPLDDTNIDTVVRNFDDALRRYRNRAGKSFA